LGQQGEDLAVKHLKQEGFTILARNVQLGNNEIDIIAREGDTVAFVEVKTKRGTPLTPPECNVTERKKHKIRRAAKRYIDQQHENDTYYRFDIVSIIVPDDDKPIITLFRNAFPDT
jgi:putative endonuclease